MSQKVSKQSEEFPQASSRCKERGGSKNVECADKNYQRRRFQHHNGETQDEQRGNGHYAAQRATAARRADK